MTIQTLQTSAVEMLLPRIEGEVLCTAAQVFLQGLGAQTGILSVLLGDDALLRQLNREHRGKDSATDVLAWSYWQESAHRLHAEKSVLGDVLLSLEKAAQQANANGWSLQTELLRLLAHGCAHIAGWSHDTPTQDEAMKRVESTLLKKVGAVRLYPA